MHLGLSDTGVRAKERDRYDVQVEQLALPNKSNSNVNTGRALSCRCIQSDQKCPDRSENVGDCLEVSSALHADGGGKLGLIHAGELRYIGHILSCPNRQSGLIHADANADVLNLQRLDGERVVI